MFIPVYLIYPHCKKFIGYGEYFIDLGNGVFFK